MNLWELFVIAVGLSMDAFAVSICKGLSMKKMSWKNGIIAGLYFGGFQAGMPLIGYVLGTQFKVLITSIDHWLSLIHICSISRLVSRYTIIFLLLNHFLTVSAKRWPDEQLQKLIHSIIAGYTPAASWR